MRPLSDQPWLAPAWSILIGLVLVMSKMGLAVLDPFYIDWLIKAGGDLAAHYMGWHFYKLSPLTLPLGTIANYTWPQVTNIGYTDSIPLLAIPCRILFGWVAAPFQYFGFWYLSCYALGIYFSWRILNQVGIQDVITLMGGSVLIGITPFLLFRWGHDALSAQWLILAVFLVYLQAKDPERHTFRWLVCLTLASAFIHPYLTLAVFVLTLPAWWRYWSVQAATWKKKVLTLAGMLLGIFLSWALIGYFQISSDDAKSVGFGEYSANLNTFFNPLNFSAFLPALPLAHPSQYEGFSYLGFGMLILLAQNLIFHQHRFFPGFSTHKGMWWALIGLSVFALSHQWTIGSIYLFKWHFSDHFTGMFRSSGRFIWPAAYALLILILIGIDRLPATQRVKHILILLALFIQVTDLQSLWKRNDRMGASMLSYVEAPQWDSILVTSTKVILYPPLDLSLVHWNDFTTIGLRVAPYKIPITTGYLSRYDEPLRKKTEEDVLHLIQTGDFSNFPGALLISGKNSQHYISDLLAARMVKVWYLDEYFLIVARDHPFSPQHPEPLVGRILQLDLGEGLPGFLERNRPNTVLITVSDEASEKLCEEARTWFEQAGSHIQDLQFRSSWLAIFNQGKLVQEAFATTDSLTMDVARHDVMESWSAPADIRMASGGALNQMTPILEINGVNVADRHRGIQIAVLDTLGKVIETACFDTYTDCYTRRR
ncbi:MAG: DUF6311 domain-containing protein [Saprospiraceae bacterium]|nr:DUF6311 domain-containing protein [Saprospiraceae bacterium]